VAKLEEIDRRVQLLRPGQRVLDLGAAPGSWSLYAAQRIGASGRLLAVDRSLIEIALPAHASFRQADVLAVVASGLDGPYDVVLSDMAPSTTGTPSADQAQSFELFVRALEIARDVLASDGAFVGKIFMGPDFAEAKRRVKAAFTTERTIRPCATRGSSFEIFVIGLGAK
jgi:23S rRNA (uridine2552-2'-O)-methyltransferase